jgi:hypothetical protein
MRRDVDDALAGWPYDPEPGEVVAREVRARDGRTVVQVRVELGVLQMEVGGRPDGTRPHGFATYLDYLRYRRSTPGDADWQMNRDMCRAADREFVQYYHRREAWLALQRYDRALRDADHTLALMDFVREFGIDEEYIASHEKFRGLVLFHRTRAAAALSLERRRPDEAVDAVHEGVERLAQHAKAWADRPESSDVPNASLIEQLRLLSKEIRKNFAVPKTLREQLDEAVADEDYERAARLRDQIRARSQR